MNEREGSPADLAPVSPPWPADRPVFAAPWQAQAFALTVRLHETGCFTWPEWTQALAEAIRRAQAAGDKDLGDTYYEHWLAALESIVTRKGILAGADIKRRTEAWRAAAARTPHGEPIRLLGETEK